MECHHYDEFWGGMHCIACEQAEQIKELKDDVRILTQVICRLESERQAQRTAQREEE